MPDEPFKARQAARVLKCVEFLKELRLRASDWKPKERRSLLRLLSGLRIVLQADWEGIPDVEVN